MMFDYDRYKGSPENIKDIVLEENRILTRKLAESQQSFELLKLVHFDRTINLEKLNDIIIGCTGCLHSMMVYRGIILTNLKPEDTLYQHTLNQLEDLTNGDGLTVFDSLFDEITVMCYPVSVSQINQEQDEKIHIILMFPKRLVNHEVRDFVKSFMLVNDVLVNIVISREKMVKLIETDPLTKLLNRSSWNSTLETIVRHPDSFFILFIDLDKFKVINDTFGHQTGDEILKETGHWLRSVFREDDRVFRLGGDEFAVTGKINPESADGFYAKIQSLNEQFTKALQSKLQIEATISIGALFTKNAEDKDSLYLRVDRLLYKSKEKGRNTLSAESDFA